MSHTSLDEVEEHGLQAFDEAKHAAGSRIVLVPSSDIEVSGGRVFRSPDAQTFAATIGVTCGDQVANDLLEEEIDDGFTAVRLSGQRSRTCVVTMNNAVLEGISCTCPRPFRYKFACPHQIVAIIEIWNRIDIAQRTAQVLFDMFRTTIHQRWDKCSVVALSSTSASSVTASSADPILPGDISSMITEPRTATIKNLELTLSRLRVETPAVQKNAIALRQMSEAILELTGGRMDLVRGTGTGSASNRSLSGEIPNRGTNGPEPRGIGPCDIGSHASKSKKQKSSTVTPSAKVKSKN